MDINSLINQGMVFQQDPIDDYGDTPRWIASIYRNDFFQWRMQALAFIQNKYGNIGIVRKFEETIKDDKDNGFLYTLNSLLGILDGLKDINPDKNVLIDYCKTLEMIFEHFHRFARQLEKRHDKRPPLVIKDEYDVQDILNAVLKLHFDDVRPEEWVPSYAGGNKRMDFLLKDANIAIEVKMTKEKLKEKEVGEQLLIDIANYKQHPDVKTLYCFVYDKDNLIYNPIGIEKDLNKQSTEDMQVKVFIRPQ